MNDSDFEIVIKEEATSDFEIYGNGFVGGNDLSEKHADSKKGHISASESEIEYTLKPHSNEIKAELLEFHNLYRLKSVIVCKSCDRLTRTCKCCIRPTDLNKKLNFEVLSKCAGCLQHIIDGKKVCIDSVACRELEKQKRTWVSAEILEFHHLFRNKTHPSRIQCKSCDKSFATKPVCRCCIRPTHLTKYLTLDVPSKCAGCLQIIKNGEKLCSEIDSEKCRYLEKTHKRDEPGRTAGTLKRKSDYEMKNEANREVLNDTFPQTRSKRKKKIPAKLLVYSLPGVVEETSGLHIISDYSSESETGSDIKSNEPNLTKPPKSTSSILELTDTDPSSTQLSKMNFELLKQNRELTTENAKLAGKVSVSEFKNEQANQKIKFLEKQVLNLQDQLKDATVFLANV